MKKLICLLAPVIFLITACVPSQEAIQKAIAETQAAMPASTQTATKRPARVPTYTRVPPTQTPSPSPADAIPILDPFHPIVRLSLAASERVLELVAGADGNIWLTTDLRILRYGQGTWNDYLSQFSGTLIGLDSDQHVWVANDDRVEVWDGTAWTSFGSETGWKPLPVLANGMENHWSVATDALGQVWLATEREVRMFDGNEWKVFDLGDLGMLHPEYEDTFLETTITFLEANGTIWVMSCYWIGPGPYGGGGARWYDGKAWQGSNSPVADGCATVVNEDRLGNIWLGLDNDLWRLNKLSGNWESFPPPNPPEGNRFGFFTDMALDAKGNPWPELAICGGASCGTGYVRYHFTGGEWLQIEEVGFGESSLYFDATGQGWVFAYDRVFRIAENQLEPVAELSILKVAVDPAGKLWVIGVYEGETVLWAQTLDG